MPRQLRDVRRGVRALLLSCHPLPTAGVTLLGAGLCLLAGLSFGQALLVVAAVLTGQLSIGWSNDRLDAARDRQVGRADKPVAQGDVPVRLVTVAAAGALLATVVLSLLCGWGAVPLLLLTASGWAYNLGLKATAASVLPYLVGFGAFPAGPTLAGGFLPPWWAFVAGALFGAAAHLGNVLPDLTDDAVTGVRGLPHRLGARRTAAGVPVLLGAASVVLALAGLPAALPVRLVVAFALVAVAMWLGVVGVRRPRARLLFPGVLAVTVADLLLFALAGRPWR